MAQEDLTVGVEVDTLHPSRLSVYLEKENSFEALKMRAS